MKIPKRKLHFLLFISTIQMKKIPFEAENSN